MMPTLLADRAAMTAASHIGASLDERSRAFAETQSRCGGQTPRYAHGWGGYPGLAIRKALLLARASHTPGQAHDNGVIISNTWSTAWWRDGELPASALGHCEQRHVQPAWTRWYFRVDAVFLLVPLVGPTEQLNPAVHLRRTRVVSEWHATNRSRR
jgi:hypothetical protein